MNIKTIISDVIMSFDLGEILDNISINMEIASFTFIIVVLILFITIENLIKK